MNPKTTASINKRAFLLKIRPPLLMETTKELLKTAYHPR